MPLWVQNTASKAAEVFKDVSGFDLEDLLVDPYYWFEKKYKKKKMNFQSFAVFVTWSIVKVVKHVSTHWLSLEYVVDRTQL